MISVIIDNYNYGKYISEAIESVLHQTYNDYELIIVDDGSNDNSKDIILDYCNRYKDKITAVFKPNGGQASAFNIGYKLSKGDIICFLDSDDYWYNNKLEVIAEYHKKYDFIGHNKKYPSGNPVVESQKFINQRQRLLKEYGQTFLLATSTMSFNRNLLDNILPMPEKEYRICADNYLMIYALYLSNIKYIDDSLVFYRVHDNNGFIGRSDVKLVDEISLGSITLINKKLESNNQEPIPYIDYDLKSKLLKIEEGISIESKEYIIYGTGIYSHNVKKYLEYCGAKVKYYCDTNSQKWDMEIEGIKVISPNELLQKRKEYYKIFIASMWIYEISDSLNKLGLKKDKDYIYSEIGF